LAQNWAAYEAGNYIDLAGNDGQCLDNEADNGEDLDYNTFDNWRG
jgi:hypothetical protein